MRPSRSSSAAASLVSIVLAACGDPTPATTGAPAPSASAPASAGPAAPAGPAVHAPKHRDGSAAALSTDGRHVFVAGEDHHVVFVAPTSFSDPLTVQVVPMPGPPAQVVVADDLVLITVRNVPTDDARAVLEEVRGPLTDAGKARRLASETLGPPSSFGTLLAPAAYRRYLEDGEIPPRGAPPPKARSAPPPGASASAQGSASSRAPKPKPPPKKADDSSYSNWRAFDPNIARKSRGGLLLVMKPDAAKGLVEVGRVALPPDAWGLAATPDGTRAVVTSAWPAKVSLVDIHERRVIASLPTAREPRGVTITKDGKTAYVAHLAGSDLTRIDDLSGAPKVSPQPLPAAPLRSYGVPLGASLGYSLVLSPNEKYLYVPRHAPGADGHDTWWGSPTVDVLDRITGKPTAPAGEPKSPAHVINADDMARSDWPFLASPGRLPRLADDLVQPRAVVYRTKTDTLLVAGEGMDTVVELDALAPDPAMFIERVLALAVYDYYGQHPVRGGGPRAIVLSEDEGTAYVYCGTTYDLVKVDLETRRSEWLRLADDSLPEHLAKGRRLFSNARTWELSQGLGCAACHPEGRDDGYAWRMTSFEGEPRGRFLGRGWNMKGSVFGYPDGLVPRQTMMLAGRVRAAGPYGWRGEAPDLIARIQEATELHRGSWVYADLYDDLGPYLGKIDALARYLRWGLLPPPTEARDLTEQEKRGKGVFESAEAQCAKCHVPETDLTDRTSYPLRPLPVLPEFAAEKGSFRTPSLLFLAGTAPYFHDGSQATLEDLVRTNGSRMGQTGHLNAEDQAALVAYLKTL